MAFRKTTKGDGCLWRWKLDQLDELRSKDSGIHMDFGTSVHEAIELYRSSRSNPYATVDAVVFFFKEKFKWLHGQNSSKYRQKEREMPVEQFLSYGENILRNLHRCRELFDATVVFNEHKLLAVIERDDLSMMFKGFIDMVIKTKDKRGNTVLYVVDFKTCSWGWDRDKKQDRDTHFQVLLYKHFLCKEFDLDPRLVRTVFVLLKKRPRGNDIPVEWFPVSAGPVSVQRALDELNSDLTQIRSRIERSDWPKDRTQCVNRWGDTCPYLGTTSCPK